MIISFDLDDTLIPTTKKFDVEKQIFSQNYNLIELLIQSGIKNTQIVSECSFSFL